MDSYLVLLRITEFRNAFLLRGFIVWGGLRLAFLAIPAGPPTLPIRFLLVVIVALAIWLDARRRGELRFLANLGVSPSAAIAVSVALPTVLEFVIP
jgi:hypothetical protein